MIQVDIICINIIRRTKQTNKQNVFKNKIIHVPGYRCSTGTQNLCTFMYVPHILHTYVYTLHTLHYMTYIHLHQHLLQSPYKGRRGTIGSGCASVLNTHLSNGTTSSSENNKYKYFNVSANQKDSILSLNTTGARTTLLIDE